MNLVADLVQQNGGKLGVATVPGKFTRFTIMLPGLAAAATVQRSA
jgi:signal transduction histidine kinase